MAYTPTVWETGDVITAVKLNKAENGIAAATDIVYIPVTVGNDGYETEFAFADALALVGSKQMVIHIDASASEAAADQVHYFYYFYQMDGAKLYFAGIVLDDVSGTLVPAALEWTESGITDYPDIQ